MRSSNSICHYQFFLCSVFWENFT